MYSWPFEQFCFKAFLPFVHPCICYLFLPLKIYSLVGNIKNDLVNYFMQHIRNGLIIDLINS